MAKNVYLVRMSDDGDGPLALIVADSPAQAANASYAEFTKNSGPDEFVTEFEVFGPGDSPEFSADDRAEIADMTIDFFSKSFGKFHVNDPSLGRVT